MNPEAAQAVRDALVEMIQSEHAATCQVLAAVTEAGKDYRPDEKSRTAWEIAKHIATSDVWFVDCIAAGKFSMDAGAAATAEAQFKTPADVVGFYKAAMAAKLAVLKGLSGADLTRTVDFFGVMQMPAVNFIGFMNNHSIHHRGQLAGYLRALGSKVPNIYGPSADAEPAAS
ncbi:MAG: DinB family protein [Vicinamibacterales bacterium]